MKVLFAFLFWLLTIVADAQSTASVVIPYPSRPKPARLVNDYSGTLTTDEKSILENRLRDYNDSTTTQIAVVIVNTTGKAPIGEYATELGKRWGVGTKLNNGIIVLWAVSDRKVFIATGYGIEPYLPNDSVSAVIDRDIIPLFKQGLYYQGLSEGISGLIRRLSGSYSPVEKPPVDLVSISTIPVIPSTRYALIIGNSAYSEGRGLGGRPLNDARDTAERLRQMGFTVVISEDLIDKQAFEKSFQNFGRQARGADVALFFYAGHGLEVAGENYVIPIGAKLGMLTK